MRDLPEVPEIDELQRIAAALVDKPLADLLAIHKRADGSLVVVVSPGPKFVFTAEQVEAARAVLRDIRPALEAEIAALAKSDAHPHPPEAAQTPSETGQPEAASAPHEHVADPAPAAGQPTTPDSFLFVPGGGAPARPHRAKRKEPPKE